MKLNWRGVDCEAGGRGLKGHRRCGGVFVGFWRMRRSLLQANLMRAAQINVKLSLEVI